MSGLDATGTSEDWWRSWLTAHPIPALQVPPKKRAVIVSPHPDDETLALGGLIAGHERCLLVAVTDGEASHPTSRVLRPAQLADRRRAERREALVRLGRADLPRVLLGLRDGAVDATRLSEELSDILRPGDVCLATWRHDGHPDHEAVGRAAAAATGALGLPLWEYPVWTWHWATPADPRVPWHRARALHLTEELRSRKEHALEAFRTQIAPLGSAPDEAAVLPAPVLAHFRRAEEIVFVDAAHSDHHEVSPAAGAVTR